MRERESELEPVIVGAVRTPVGRRNGGLAGVHAVDLGAVALAALVERSGIDPVLVDDVIMGCVSQIGEQSANLARNAWLAAGLPEEVPATTIDRQCGSSQQAVQFAAQGIMAGGYQLVVAGGVEHMTRVPMGSTMSGPGVPFGPAMHDRYQGRLVPQGISAELIAEKWGLTREEQDEFALRSHGGRPPPRTPAASTPSWSRSRRPGQTETRPGCGPTRGCGGTPRWRSWPG